MDPDPPDFFTRVYLILVQHKVSTEDFWELDNHPGNWGYEFEGREWHWKLRRFRNNPAQMSRFTTWRRAERHCSQAEEMGT